MRLTEEAVDYAARLARLEVPAGERAALAAELERIVEDMDVLGGLDAGAAGPEEAAPLGNVLRADVAEPSLPREELLACAPDTDGAYLLVPRAVE